jgi:translation initiation factor 5A
MSLSCDFLQNLYKRNYFLGCMVARVIDATEMRVGTFILLDSVAHQVKKMDISKTGKHGHAKVRYEASSIMTGKKKVAVIPGHDRFEIPMIDKRVAQVLSIAGDVASLMDSESFENFDLPISESVEGVAAGGSVEYWVVEDDKLIRKAL